MNATGPGRSVSGSRSLVIEHPLRTMRIDNAFTYMMERGAGSSKVTSPPRYDVEDCHECVSSTTRICKFIYSHVVPAEFQGIHKGYSTTTEQISLIYSRFLVFGYTEYKGKQKEIFDAAINGM